MSKVLVLDTETTGIDEFAEVLEMAIVDAYTGEVLLNRRFAPRREVTWAAAQRVHGITPAAVRGLPTLDDVWPQIAPVLASASEVWSYNAAFDTRVIAQSVVRTRVWHDLPPVRCAMLAYAEYRREPSPYGHEGWRWHKLLDAARDCDFNWAVVEAHTALGDALASAAVVRALRYMDSEGKR